MRTRTIVKASIAGAVATGCVSYFWRRALNRETEKLTAILGWRDGASVADVGAGSGRLTMAAAHRVGRTGQVFATEIDPKKFAGLQRKTRKSGFDNVTILKAEGGTSGLPRGCCDAILLRGSYHHLSDPHSMTADLYRALRPGGVVAVIDFPPRLWLSWIAPVNGVPANRGGHGIPMEVLIQEMTETGFVVSQRISRWLFDVYCVVFRKPDCQASGHGRKNPEA